jgi:PAS domain S-box-containing protein
VTSQAEEHFRAQAERRPKRSAEMLRLALDAADQGAWGYDIAADRPIWDEKTFALFGLARGSPLSYARVVNEIIHPQDRERVDAAVRAAMDPAGDGRYDVEHRVIHPDGEVRWLSVRGRALFEGEGEGRRAVWMLGTVRDITEQRKAQEALRREREALRTIIDTIPVMITMYDPEVKVLLPNREFERLTGWSARDAASGSLMEKCYPDPQYREDVRKFMDGCEGWMDIRLHTREGGILETSWANVRLADHRRIGIGLNISKRKASEKALAESEARLRHLFESIDEGYALCELLFDADGEPTDYRFVEVNPLFEEMTGLKDAEGRTAYEMLPELEPHWLEAYSRVALGGESLRFEQSSETMGRHFDVFATPVQPRGRFAIVFKDITARRKAEAALIESEARLWRVLDQLFAFVGVLTPEGVVQYANQAPLEAAGIALHDVVGKRFDQAYWWSHDEAVQTQLRDAMQRAAKGEAVRYDVAVRMAGGRLMTIDFQIAPMRDENGTVIGLIPSAIDIDERVAAQEDLRQAHALIEGITRGTSELIAAEDHAFRYLFFNDAYKREFKKLWGREIEVGMSMIEALAPWPEDQRKATEIWSRALNGETFNITMAFGPDEREKHIYDLRFAPVLDAEGRQIGAAHILREVTEQVRLQEALKESERRANRIVESIADGFITLDKDWRITFLNQRGEDILRPLGRGREELLGEVFWEAFPETQGSVFDETYRRAAREQTMATVEAFYPPLDSWFDVRAYPSEDGVAIHFLDISERKKAEKQRELLVNELNHRVKNTLAVVQGLAQQTFKRPDVPAVATKAFESRLTALAAAHNLLTRSNWGKTSLAELARETLEATLAHDARIHLQGPPVILKPKQAITLAMALHELCTNAIKYGALSTETGRVELHWNVSNSPEPRLTLVWRERGGPPVEPPTRRGFGSRMVVQAISQEFDGKVTMDFPPEGLVYKITDAVLGPDAPPE